MEVAEFQGIYGPYTVTELLLQKIWMRGHFRREGLATADGMPLAIRHPGQWNRLGGPDFKGARLLFGDREATGDVEVHFREEDWRRHGHERDPAYNGTVLHVVLFPPKENEARAETQEGRIVPCLPLLDLLHHDLEEYAADERFESGDFFQESERLLEELLERSLHERRRHLLERAARRWKQKIHFAALRCDRLGWDDACHHAALEGLGYRPNRGPMLAVAARYPLRRMAEEAPDPETIMREMPDSWEKQGLRPANRPEIRLAQYRNWVKARSDWPDRLVEELAAWPRADVSEPDDDPEALLALSSAFRRERDLPALRRRLERMVAAGAVPGNRFLTLVCDAFFPLAAARGQKGLFPYWFFWYPGDAPDAVRKVLREAKVTNGRAAPLANGWVQGALFSLLGSS